MKKNSVLPSTIELTSKFIKSVKCTLNTTTLFLNNRRRKQSQMKNLTQRKQLVDACKKLGDEFIKVIKEAEEKNDMKLII